MLIETRNRLMFFIFGVIFVSLSIFYLNFYHYILLAVMVGIINIFIALEIRKLHSHYFKKSRQDNRLFITRRVAKKIKLKRERKVLLNHEGITCYADLKDISASGIRITVDCKFKFQMNKIFNITFFKTNNQEIKFDMNLLRERKIESDITKNKNKKVIILLFNQNDIDLVEIEFQVAKYLDEGIYYINTNSMNILSPLLFSLLAVLQNFGILSDIYSLYLLAALTYFILLKEIFRDDIDDFSRILPSIYINILTLIYPSFFGHYLIKLFKFKNQMIVMMFFLMIVLNDGAAFGGGKAFGRKSSHPFPVSPKKTFIGLVCGFLSSIITGLFIYYINPSIAQMNLSFIEIGFLGAIMGILTPFGDLVASALKRSTSVKESSNQNIFGRGGFLDNMDSIIFTALVYYYYINYFSSN